MSPGDNAAAASPGLPRGGFSVDRLALGRGFAASRNTIVVRRPARRADTEDLR